MSTPSVEQLERAIEISEELEQLQAELSELLNSGSAPVSKAVKREFKPAAQVEEEEEEAPQKRRRKGKRSVSPEARAKMAAAQKARWARARGER